MTVTTSAEDVPTPECSSFYTPAALEFCRKLPKVELHAHLNGCVRDETIRQLISENPTIALTEAELNVLYQKGEQPSNPSTPAGNPSIDETQGDAGAPLHKGNRKLADCFKLFDIIHKITTSHETITRITKEVISDFAAENVVYLELRTTPKNRPECGMTKESYVAAVLRGMQQYAQEHPASPAMVKLLLSIDRREDAADAMATVQLAACHQGEGVVGVDLSGNPYVGSWSSWEGALQAARSAGLKVTLHAGEVYRPEETSAMLSFQPDRLGHMCCLDQGLETQLLESQIPLELCLTSNVKTKSVAGYTDHHFSQLYNAGHPVVLCTDDSGVFATSLSEEYAIAMASFQLTEPHMKTLVTKSLEYVFAAEKEKEKLRDMVMCHLDRLA